MAVLLQCRNQSRDLFLRRAFLEDLALAHAGDRRGLFRLAGRTACALGRLAQDVGGDDHALDLVRALVDRGDLGVAVHALHIHALEEARAAEDLQSVVGDLERDVGRIHLCHCGLGGVRLMRFLELRRGVDQHARTAQLGRHVRDLERDRLLEADRLAELDALLGVIDCRFVCALRDAERLRRDADAAAVQRRHRDLEALTFLAEQVFLGHLDVVEDQLRGGRGADAHFVVMVAEGEALPAFFDDKGRDAARADIRRGDREYHIGIRLGGVGDKDLAAVEQVVVAFVDGGGLGAARIRTGVGLGQAERADLFALCQRDEVFLLLFLGAKCENRPRAERHMGGQDNACATVHARELLHGDRVAQHIQPGAAIFFRVGQTHIAELAHFLDRFRGEAVFLVHEESLRLYLALRKSADLSAQLFVHIGGSEQHGETSFIGSKVNLYQMRFIIFTCCLKITISVFFWSTAICTNFTT